MEKEQGQVGKAGDPLPPFVDHMIRHRVSRSGHVFPLAPASEIPACMFPADKIGWPKYEALKGWVNYRETVTNVKFASQRQKSKPFIQPQSGIVNPMLTWYL